MNRSLPGDMWFPESKFKTWKALTWNNKGAFSSEEQTIIQWLAYAWKSELFPQSSRDLLLVSGFNLFLILLQTSNTLTINTMFETHSVSISLQGG